MKVENLEFEVKKTGSAATKSINDLTKALKELAESFEKLQNASMPALNGLKQLTKAIRSAMGGITKEDVNKFSAMARAMKDLADATARYNKQAKAQRKNQQKTSKQQKQSKEDLTQMQKLLNVTGQGAAQLARSMYNAYKPITQIGEDLKGIVGGITSGAMAGAKAGPLGALIGGAFGGLSSAASAIVRDYSNVRKAVAETALATASKYGKAIWNTIPVVKFSNAVKNVASSLSQLGAGLARIAMYRILRTAIKEITSALEEGIEALYLYDQTASNVFAPTMDTIKTNLGSLKSTITTIAANLINLLAPAINAILSLVDRLASALSSLFAALGGKIFYKASGQALKYAEAAKSGAAATKEWKNQLMGFDEINKLTDTTSSGGGSGADTTSDFGWIEASLPDWAQVIKNLIDNGNWVAAGRALAYQLKNMLKQFDPLTWGKELGGKIQHGIDFALGFFSDKELSATIGTTIANALNGILGSINGGTIGSLLASIANSIWTTLYSFITTFSFLDFAIGLTNMMNAWVQDIDTKLIADTLITLFGNVLDGLAYFIENFDLSAAIEKFAEFTKTLFEGIGQKLIDSDIAGKLMAWIETVDWDKAITDIVSGINAILDAMIEQFNKLDTQKISNIISTMMQKIDFEKIGALVGDLLRMWIDIKLSLLQAYIRSWATSTLNWLTGGLFFNTKNYADGGIVKAANGLDTNQEGQLFIAREAGPELVGTFGSHTGVMNNDQIVAAVSEGVYNAVSSAMGGRNDNVSVKVYLDSREIKAGQQRLNRAMGV